MKRIVLFFALLLFVNSVSAQLQRGRNGRMNQRNMGMGGVPQSQPSERDIERQKEEAEEKRQEFVAEFMTTLEADEFQKQILKQTLDDFYIKSQEFVKLQFPTHLERKDAYENLTKAHFAEIKSLISEDDAKKLDDLLNGDYNTKDAKKDKKKKRKKRRKKNRD